MPINIRLITTLVLLLMVGSVQADDEFLEMFIQGQYLLVGKALESDETYHGKVTIESDGDGLKVNRIIDGVDIRGEAAIEEAVGGEARVLRIRFQQDGNDYEETCLVDSDLDNYARISCYLYKPGVQSRQPGLEVLFYDHGS